jgi:hypothetical protein
LYTEELNVVRVPYSLLTTGIIKENNLKGINNPHILIEEHILLSGHNFVAYDTILPLCSKNKSKIVLTVKADDELINSYWKLMYLKNLYSGNYELADQQYITLNLSNMNAFDQLHYYEIYKESKIDPVSLKRYIYIRKIDQMYGIQKATKIIDKLIYLGLLDILDHTIITFKK